MTLDEIRNSEKPMLTPADVAPVLGVNPHSIRVASPSELGFPVAKIGNRTLIPRKPFLAFVEGST